jgi:hypothetical protein
MSDGRALVISNGGSAAWLQPSARRMSGTVLANPLGESGSMNDTL